MSLKSSIRWQLPLSYAGIAMITTCVLGVILITLLQDFYQKTELDNLKQNARTISQLLAQESVPISKQVDYSKLTPLALAMDTQLELLDSYRNPIYNSGVNDTLIVYVSPNQILGSTSTATIALANAIPTPAYQITDTQGIIAEELPYPVLQAVSITEGDIQLSESPIPFESVYNTIDNIPMNRTSFGTLVNRPQQIELLQTARQRSSQIVVEPIFNNNSLLGYVQLSNSATAGYEILQTVKSNWLIAAALAGGVAAIIGIFISHRITQPLRDLNKAVTTLTKGDLSVRAELNRQDEIGQLSQSFNDMAARIETTVYTLRDFVADAAHEIHTPLTAIRTNLELYLEQANPVNIHRALRQVDRLQHLTDNLLDLSRLEGKAHPNRLQVVDLRNMACRLSEIYASRAEQADIDFKFYLTQSPSVEVVGNHEQLQRAIMNLLDNALKFTPTGGTVYFSLNTTDHRAVISVMDNGIGISETDLPHLFKRFRRGRNTANYAGNGLGLAIVKAIIAHHRGEIQVQSKPGKTNFTVALPLKPSY